METESSISPDKSGTTSTWFDKMGESLIWKVIPPDILNPFKDPLPDTLLHEWINSPAALRRATCIKVLCDGYEVLFIKNLVTPMFCSEHPCITKTPFNDIVGYMQRGGVEALIEQELNRTREEIRAEIERRYYETREYGDGMLVPIKERKKALKIPKYGSTVRLIKG